MFIDFSHPSCQLLCNKWKWGYPRFISYWIPSLSVSRTHPQPPSSVNTATAQDIQTPGWDKKSHRRVIRLLTTQKLELIKFHDVMSYKRLLALLSETSVLVCMRQEEGRHKSLSGCPFRLLRSFRAVRDVTQSQGFLFPYTFLRKPASANGFLFISYFPYLGVRNRNIP